MLGKWGEKSRLNPQAMPGSRLPPVKSRLLFPFMSTRPFLVRASGLPCSASWVSNHNIPFFFFFCIGATFDLKPMTLWNTSNLQRVISLTHYLDEQLNPNGMTKKQRHSQGKNITKDE